MRVDKMNPECLFSCELSLQIMNEFRIYSPIIWHVNKQQSFALNFIWLLINHISLFSSESGCLVSGISGPK